MIILLLCIPLITAIGCYAFKNINAIRAINLVGSVILAAMSVPLIISAFSAPHMMLNGMLSMDGLSAYIMALIVFLGVASAIYSVSYLAHEMAAGLTDLTGVRRYYALLHLFILAMLLVTVANNLALMWIAIEATTIISALLIGLGFYKRHLAVEAAWKYIILCSVGITFALLGVFITYYASFGALGGKEGTLNWTELKGIASQLNPATMKLSFIFILVGYGTKAGFAPLHNWLPDAHTQAPSPISALLSGILLNTAFYGIMRFVAIVEPSTGSVFTGNLLMLFGLISIGLSSIFILVQQNYKRLLAYSSIEHMGIISLGAGIGGPVALYGALLHVLNHALAKPLMFLASGKIQARYGSTKIEKVSGVLSSMPFLGTLAFIGVFALAGAPPFNIFISEFTILKGAVDKGLWAAVVLFLIFAMVVFYGMVAGFSRMLFGKSSSDEQESAALHHERGFWSFCSGAVMCAMALMIIFLGINVPDFIDAAIRSCITVLGVK